MIFLFLHPLVYDIASQCVIHSPCTYLSINGLNLLQGGEHEHSCLAHTGLCLAQDVHAQDGLGDALVLHWNGKTLQLSTGRQLHRFSLAGRGQENDFVALLTTSTGTRPTLYTAYSNLPIPTLLTCCNRTPVL